jgi:geranylgeranyl pyrophosphate synthase
MNSDVFSFDTEKLVAEIYESIDNAQQIFQHSILQNDISDNEYKLLLDSLMKSSGIFWEDGSGLGKLIRPRAVFEATNVFKGNIDAAYKIGASIQMIHNFSLVHDDVQDHSTTRRGRPTLWREVGVAQAINIGDELFALAYDPLFRLMQSGIDYLNMFDVIQTIHSTIIKLTHGQYLDINYENKRRISLNAYIRMIEDKTGALFSSSLQCAGIISNKNDSIETLSKFGTTLGIIFQAIDDYENIWGNESQYMSKVDEDLYNKKKSLPVILAINKDDHISNEVLSIYKKDIDTDAVSRLHDIFNDNNIKEDCIQFISEQNHNAINILAADHFLEDAEKEALLEFKNSISEGLH